MAKDYNGNFPLETLAKNRHGFLSGSRLNFWKKLIYNGIRIRPLPPINDNRVNESGQSDQRHLSNKNENQKPLSDQKENQRHFSCSGMGLFIGLVKNLQKLLGINRIYEMKLIHEQVKQFLPIISEEKRNLFLPELKQVLCVAAERGHAEFLTHFLGEALDIQATNNKRQNVFQIAAECRYHKVYNLIYLLDEFLKEDPDKQKKIQMILGSRDNFENNILHTVARITSLSQIYHIRGAALQMQREQQWFKEVESIVDPKDCEYVNVDNRTPRQVFTDNHNDMGKEAEKSMKETATSCTVVGALIVTIMFAAAITVPGGNDGHTGLPTFLTERVFTTFIVSDAISLFSSTTSVIMFLGILTSRYSEDDFRKSLPTKMIIGLFTLFLSIATMMIVFSCALYIMLKGKSSIVIPSILLASVPVTSFIWMQFPFLVELVISTFGPGLFDRNKKKLF
ncbi:hypothetical protein ACFX2F_030046 [Malus domestica]